MRYEYILPSSNDGIVNSTSRCIVLSSVSSIVLTLCIACMLILGSHIEAHSRISDAIASSVYYVMPSYRSICSFDPNSGRRILSPSCHVKMFLNELNIAFKSTFSLTLYFESSIVDKFPDSSFLTWTYESKAKSWYNAFFFKAFESSSIDFPVNDSI